MHLAVLIHCRKSHETLIRFSECNMHLFDFIFMSPLASGYLTISMHVTICYKFINLAARHEGRRHGAVISIRLTTPAKMLLVMQSYA